MAVFSRISRPRNVALAAVLAANGVLAQNNCFTLQGITDDGTQVNYVQVSDGGTGTYTAGFTDDDTAATVLGIDPTTGMMIDYTDGGRITNIDEGFDFDYLFFDFQSTLDEFNQLALNCGTDADGILTCSAADNAAVNVFNYCDGVVAIGDRVRDDYGCQGLTLVASDAGACPALPAATTTTGTSTSTSTSISTSVSTDTAISTTTDVSTTTAVSTTTDVSTTTSASTVDAISTDTTTTSGTTTSGATTDAANPTDTTTTSSDSTTTALSTDAPVSLTTSTVFGTETVTVTASGGTVSTTISTYPLYTTVCPIGGGAAPTGDYYGAPGGDVYGSAAASGGYGGAAASGGYGYGGAVSSGGYGAPASSAGYGYGAPAPSAGYGGAAPAASVPVYNPGHLAALPSTICASQLNAVATKYPAGAMNHYESYGVTPVAPGTPGYGTGSGDVSSGGYGGYGAGAGDKGSYTGGAGKPAGNNAYGAASSPAANNGGYANGAAPNNGSAAGYVSATASWSAKASGPMQYEGSASTVKMAVGGIFAAAIALVCLI